MTADCSLPRMYSNDETEPVWQHMREYMQYISDVVRYRHRAFSVSSIYLYLKYVKQALVKS